MKRRNFLKGLAAMPVFGRSALSAVGLLSSAGSAFANGFAGKTLVVIFQRGGCDGLNTVVPYGEDEYYRLRPDIAIARPGSGVGGALDLDGFFGLHPAMSAMHEIYQQGHLAVLPTVHYHDGNRSHFTSQDFIESGTPGTKRADGWLNRYLTSRSQEADMRAVSFGSLVHALKGSTPVAAIDSLDAPVSGLDNEVLSQLSGIYQQPVSSALKERLLLKQHGELALDNLLVLDQYRQQSYIPDNGAVYPETEYGRQLRDIARLVKARAGLEVAAVNIGGWDNHSGQGGAEGTQANRLSEFSNGIAALYKDLGAAYMNDVVIVTMTEFGRTAKQNASGGTDHGNASSWFVIGHQVNGGIYGEWPGLSSEQLYLGRYLAHSTDFTDIFGEIIVKHFNHASSLAGVLPGSHYQTVGFMS
ncbi:MAG: DUF1501 domain-containing protein [Gammaproteobacteria bacterium]|jgi:uncharacterized protein (DUF1501 family)|nr:DUF1501 domain-containing protein [Gammaproteobacteria bacterium]